jgi:hypothetical protein
MVPEAYLIRSRKIGVCQTADGRFSALLAKSGLFCDVFAFWSDLFTFARE